MYAFHFYACSHGSLLQRVKDYRTKIPIFVSEWGTSSYSGDGGVCACEAKEFLDVFSDADGSGGGDAEDARALAFCGGAPPKWCAKQSSPDRIVTRARSAIARAREAAASNVERLWDVARGAENRGRGESLPSMDRLKRR